MEARRGKEVRRYLDGTLPESNGKRSALRLPAPGRVGCQAETRRSAETIHRHAWNCESEEREKVKRAGLFQGRTQGQDRDAEGVCEVGL